MTSDGISREYLRNVFFIFNGNFKIYEKLFFINFSCEMP